MALQLQKRTDIKLVKKFAPTFTGPARLARFLKMHDIKILSIYPFDEKYLEDGKKDDFTDYSIRMQEFFRGFETELWKNTAVFLDSQREAELFPQHLLLKQIDCGGVSFYISCMKGKMTSSSNGIGRNRIISAVNDGIAFLCGMSSCFKAVQESLDAIAKSNKVEFKIVRNNLVEL